MRALSCTRSRFLASSMNLSALVRAASMRAIAFLAVAKLCERLCFLAVAPAVTPGTEAGPGVRAVGTIITGLLGFDVVVVDGCAFALEAASLVSALARRTSAAPLPSVAAAPRRAPAALLPSPDSRDSRVERDLRDLASAPGALNFDIASVTVAAAAAARETRAAASAAAAANAEALFSSSTVVASL